MTKVIVHYKLKADKVAENEQLIRAVYRQLEERKIDGFQYCTMKMEDGLNFVHIAFAENDEANHAFTALSAFKDFQKSIKERCDVLPVVSPVSLIGSYNFNLAHQLVS